MENIEKEFKHLLEPRSYKESVKRKNLSLTAKFLPIIDDTLLEKNISREELSKKLGKGKKFIDKIMIGEKVLTFELLSKIMLYLDIDFDVVSKSSL